MYKNLLSRRKPHYHYHPAYRKRNLALCAAALSFGLFVLYLYAFMLRDSGEYAFLLVADIASVIIHLINARDYNDYLQ